MTKQMTLLTKWMIAPLFFLILFSCNKEKFDNSPIIEKEFNLADFKRIYATSSFNVIVTKGTSYSIKAKGHANYVNDMVLTITSGQTLDIQFDKYNNPRRVDVFITIPDLLQLTLSGDAKGEINGFAGQNHVIRTVLSGGAECVLNGAPVNVNFDISGGARLNANGTTENLYGSLSGGGRLNAYDLTSAEVDMEASGGATAYVKVQNTIFATASGGSRIYYRGNPTTVVTETSGGGQVIKD